MKYVNGGPMYSCKCNKEGLHQMPNLRGFKRGEDGQKSKF